MYNKSVSSAEAERVLVEGVLWHLDAESLERWSTCKSSHRFLSFVNKKLIVYRITEGKRVVVDTLKCLDVGMTNLGGPFSKWSSVVSEDAITIDSRPKEIYPAIFLWHTFHSDIRYQPHKGLYNVRFSMLYKSRHNPAFIQDGALYIQEQAMYDSEVVNDTL